MNNNGGLTANSLLVREAGENSLQLFIDTWGEILWTAIIEKYLNMFEIVKV